MLEACGAYNIELEQSGTITLHLSMDESRTYITHRIVDNLFFPIISGTPFIDGLIKAIHLVERKIIN